MYARTKVTVIVVIVLILLSGCRESEPTATPALTTTFPPTNTPILPTETAALTPTKTASPTQTATPVPTETGPAADTVAFADSGQELGEERSTDVALGDLDGDGDLDALVGNQGRAQVWLNDGQGNFSPNGQDLTISSGWKMGLDLGDLDGDGDPDAFIVVADGPGRVLLNQGGAQGSTPGSFVDSGQQLEASSGFGFDLDLGDLDGDGDLDAYVAYERANLVWLNDGQGGFQDSGQRLGEAITADVALADLDGDGDLDALAGGWDEPARVWLNNGQGMYVDSGYILTAAAVHIHGLDVGDLDGDSDLDVFLALASGHPNQVWFNDGQGVFNDSGQQLRSSLGHAVVLGDLDRDGDLDAFMANAVSSAGAPNTVWLNDGQGNFSDSGLRLGNGLSYGVDLGDLDGDGDLDAFVANNSPPNAVWLNGLYQADLSSSIINAGNVERLDKVADFDLPDSFVNTIVFSPDSQTMITGDRNGEVLMWDRETWEKTTYLPARSTRAADSAAQVWYWGTLALSPDGNIIANAYGDDGVVTGRDQDGQELFTFSYGERVYSVAFSSDGKYLAVGGVKSDIIIFDIESQQTVANLVSDHEYICNLVFSPEDKMLLASYERPGNVIKTWDTNTWQEIATFTHVTERTDYHDVLFSPDGQEVVIATIENVEIVFWDLETMQIVDEFPEHTRAPYQIAFSPDGSLLASASDDGTLRMWDMETGMNIRIIRNGLEVGAVAFSPDGTLIAFSLWGVGVQVWAVAP